MSEIQEKNMLINQKIEYHIRPLTFPVGIKMVKPGEKINTIKYRKLPDKYNLCQFITLARYDRCHQDVYYIEKEDIICSMAWVIMGFKDWPQPFTDGSQFLNIHHQRREDSAESVSSVPCIPKGSVKSFIIGPLEKMDVKPDIIFWGVIPGQLNRVSEGYQWFNPGGLNIRFSGICGICGWTVAKAYVDKTVAVGIPCQGARRFGNYQDIELAIAISSEVLDNFLDGLEKTFATGHSYPIGIGVYPNPPHAPHYRIIEWPNKIEKV
ncbi:MAG: DUF169 domain-containing protein [Peptococcaceae bacterium]|jgi:uncharacterized protein (DUF169 family)|nr:DUF169 domain-containing protein [Peptococcaceae bacterium]MDH7525041.1 DUF169 domain-containing protein [Peptococcaceae bacterium]